MYAFIIRPILGVYGLEQQLSPLDFLLLMVSSVLICAAGYIINDYFDTKTDNINNPESVIVGRHIKRRVAMILHIFFNFFGVVFGLLVSFRIGKIEYVVIFLIITMLLWTYSLILKRRALTGNILISILSAIVPVMVLLFELPLLKLEHDSFPQISAVRSLLVYWVFGFAFFAFFTSLIREIIKDIEDIQGDRECAYKTIPVIFGIDKTKYIITVVIFIIITSLTIISVTYLRDIPGLLYVMLTILFPLIYVLIKLFNSKLKKDYHFLSQIMKLIMLAGILYSVIARYNFDKLF